MTLFIISTTTNYDDWTENEIDTDISFPSRARSGGIATARNGRVFLQTLNAKESNKLKTGEQQIE